MVVGARIARPPRAVYGTGIGIVQISSVAEIPQSPLPGDRGVRRTQAGFSVVEDGSAVPHLRSTTKWAIKPPVGTPVPTATQYHM